MTYDLVTEASFELPDLVVPSAWADYAPVGFWLVDALRPRCIVELGVHAGFSYFVFCQEVQRLGLSTKVFGVDHWLGDPQAHFYGEDVFNAVNEYNVLHQFSTLIRSSFEEALDHFSDGSIDLLHIDGAHTYEDVSIDYEMYKPKLSERAVIIFHDTNPANAVYPGYEVDQFFTDIRRGCASFEFCHGHGLGLLAPNKVHPVMETLANLSETGANWLRWIYGLLGTTVALGARTEHGKEVELIIEATRRMTRV